MNNSIKTGRLTLRPVKLTDATYIHDLRSLPETDRYKTLGIPEDVVSTNNLVKEWLELAQLTPAKKYVYCIEDDAATIVGIIGINLGRPAYRKQKYGTSYIPPVGTKVMYRSVEGYSSFLFHNIAPAPHSSRLCYRKYRVG